jgi:hypothetical protein
MRLSMTAYTCLEKNTSLFARMHNEIPWNYFV